MLYYKIATLLVLGAAFCVRRKRIPKQNDSLLFSLFSGNSYPVRSTNGVVAGEPEGHSEVRQLIYSPCAKFWGKR
jgi:hypothetical protein